MMMIIIMPSWSSSSLTSLFQLQMARRGVVNHYAVGRRGGAEAEAEGADRDASRALR
jgi:hypothetical protein